MLEMQTDLFATRFRLAKGPDVGRLSAPVSNFADDEQGFVVGASEKRNTPRNERVA